MSRIKTLFLGIAVIFLIGVGGFIYRNAVEHSSKQIACPMDARVCPDGTSVARTGTTCTFPQCLPPNVNLQSLGISFATPDGFEATSNDMLADSYTFTENNNISTTSEPSNIRITRLPILASSTVQTTIQKAAISDGSGLPVATLAAASVGGRTYTKAEIGRFEGVVTTSYFLKRGNYVLRFDAIDRGADWTNPSLDIAGLPAHAALIKLLTTLQVQ